jgi:hypothetical protein
MFYMYILILKNMCWEGEMEIKKAENGKHAKPVAALSPKEKKLLAFIIFGAVLCIVLVAVIINKCTAMPGIVDPSTGLHAASMIVDKCIVSTL